MRKIFIDLFSNYSNIDVHISKDDVIGAETDDCMKNGSSDCKTSSEDKKLRVETALRMRGLINKTGRG